jgi:predicted kinase
MRSKPTVYILCGLTGSGKTTAARELEGAGCVRLSVDELIYDRHGVQDVDFPTSDYPKLHVAAVTELNERMAALLSEGRDVVLDYGMDFWTRAGRDRYRAFAEEHGGRALLIYMRADRELLLERLGERNRRRDANAFFVTEERLDSYIARFEEPQDEMEIVRDQRDARPRAG